MKRPMVSGVLCKRGRASCETQRRRRGASEELASHANVDVVPAEISMRRDRTWRKLHTVFYSHALHAAAVHGCDAATVTPSGDEMRLLLAETALAGSGCAT